MSQYSLSSSVDVQTDLPDIVEVRRARLDAAEEDAVGVDGNAGDFAKAAKTGANDFGRTGPMQERSAIGGSAPAGAPRADRRAQTPPRGGERTSPGTAK